MGLKTPETAEPPAGTGAASLASRLLSKLPTTIPIQISLNSPFWTLVEWIYGLPPVPRRTRDPSCPMQVICVGLPRSGTESLQQALLHLSYTHTYHGWDIVYDSPSPAPQWVHLARQRFYLGRTLTTSDFDAVLGHCMAVTDAAASVFASDLIAAYPEAKVVLNTRADEEGWKRSLEKTLVKANRSWGFWVAGWLDRECFWAWHVYERFLWPGLFRCGDRGMEGVLGNAGWVRREHYAMIRGLVPPERLLEWDISDGWEPLCKFLGKPVPDIPFPHANAAAGGWKEREEQCNRRWVNGAFMNLIVGILLMVGGLVVMRVLSR